MLINSQNIEVFKNKTRNEINNIVSGHCRSETCAENKQAQALAPCWEVWEASKFKLKDIAHLKGKDGHNVSL